MEYCVEEIPRESASSKPLKSRTSSSWESGSTQSGIVNVGVPNGNCHRPFDPTDLVYIRNMSFTKGLKYYSLHTRKPEEAGAIIEDRTMRLQELRRMMGRSVGGSAVSSTKGAGAAKQALRISLKTCFDA